MDIEQQLQIYREWQTKNPEWQLICDIGDTDYLYIQWHELPKKERMSWIGTCGSCAKDAFEEFATKKCKVEHKVLAPDLKLYDILDWPHGFCMAVFKTD